jgi:hypothetical protein
MIEKIILSHDQIADLFRNHLLCLKEEYSGHTAGLPDIKIDYKGGFFKKILWIHNETEQTYIHELDFEMVTKILEACKMNWNDIALVNLFHSGNDYDVIIQTLNPKYVILSYGNQPNYQVHTLQGRTTLYTHNLKEIRNDKNLKIQLWQALKIFFDLK